jgi:hypothetical protein
MEPDHPWIKVNATQSALEQITLQSRCAWMARRQAFIPHTPQPRACLVGMRLASAGKHS